ncbi:MAG: ABC transporter ATP-binding protein [Bacillota bacterium]
MIITELKIYNLSYQYQEHTNPIFDNLSFSVGCGEFMALVGPSGCGKTTLIHILAGLLTPTSGEILLDGSPETILGKVGLMPQQDLLLPWRTVLDNCSLPLEIKGVSVQTAREKARGVLIQFGLGGYENAFPYQLSGGMRQRAAFLQSIIAGNKIILLDEPFSALDALTRLKMQQWLLNMWLEIKPTIIFITHDVEEAVFLAQRVLLLSSPPNKGFAEFPINLPYPRSKELLGNDQLVMLRQKILNGLEKGEGF